MGLIEHLSMLLRFHSQALCVARSGVEVTKVTCHYNVLRQISGRFRYQKATRPNGEGLDDG
jgi:hypothetical protein